MNTFYNIFKVILKYFCQIRVFCDYFIVYLHLVPAYKYQKLLPAYKLPALLPAYKHQKFLQIDSIILGACGQTRQSYPNL